jgi:predicted RNA binding protein YcfA (HicA-like mRNA interferase family)
MSERIISVDGVPMKISEVIRLLEQDGWVLKRTTGSHRHFSHPTKPGLVTVAGKRSATLKPKTEASILKQAGLVTGTIGEGRKL